MPLGYGSGYGGGGGVTPGGKAGLKPFGFSQPPAVTAPSGPSAQQQRWEQDALDRKKKLDEYNAATGGGGGMSSGAGGGGMSSASPYGAAGESAGTLQDFGTGLLDPESDLSKRWMEQLRENIGGATDAAQRAAGYQAAQSGFGGGASPEVLEMQNELGVAGREAEGTAASDYLLRAPSMGIGALGTALGGQTQMRGQDLSARLAEMGLTQSGEQSNAQLEMQQRNLDLERERMEQDRYLRELMLEYGGY